MPFSLSDIIAKMGAAASGGAKLTLRTGIQLGGKLGNAFVGGTFNSATREADYISNVAARNLMPGLDQLLTMYHSGMLGDSSFKRWAANHGADFSNEGFWSPGRASLWRNVRTLTKPHYPLDALRLWTRQGRAGAGRLLDRALTVEGFPTPADQAWFTDEWEPLSLSMIVELFLKGAASPAEFLDLMKILGYRENEAQIIMQLTNSAVPVGEALTLWNYGLFDENTARNNMRAAGYIEGSIQDIIAAERFVPPSPTGLYLLGQRGTWNDIFAQKWGLDDDMPPQVREWAKRLGLDFSAGVDKYGTEQTAAGDVFTWAKALWRGQWQLPSMGDLSQIIYRFRGDPNDASTWSQPGYPPLSQDEIWDVMRANGAPTLLRNYFGRIVYSPINLRMSRLMIQYGGWGLTEVIGNLQDNGLSPADARQVGPALIASMQKGTTTTMDRLASKTFGRLITGIEDAYKTGVLNHAAAQGELMTQGVPAQLATNILAVVDIEANTAMLKQVVAHTRSDVLSGRITFAEAIARLGSTGMDPVRVQHYVTTWRAEFTEHRKQLSTQKVLSLLRKNLLTPSAALSRLDNLGWTKPDELLLLAEVRSQVDRDKASAAKALETTARGEERKIVSTLRDMQATATRLLGRLRTITPVGEILKFYKKGLWTEREVRGRLQMLGYPDGVIDDMLLAELGLPAGSPLPETAPQKKGQANATGHLASEQGASGNGNQASHQ